MARQLGPRPNPVLRSIVLPIVQWGVAAAILVGLAVLVAGEVRDPAVLGSAAQLGARGGDAGADSGAFSLGALHERLPSKAIARVQEYIEFFQSSQRRRLVDGLSRSTRYLGRFKAIFREAGLPEELAYLPLIESGYVETAISPAAAVGMWQFIEETGRRYNLHRTDWADQRLDPFQSARAAARLLKNLHGKFGNWELALAAYNAGAGTVKWARRVNRKAGKPTDFWSLDLPEETAEYVPTFLAAVLIAKNPPAFGIKGIRPHAEVAYDLLKVSPGTYLHEVAAEIGVPLDTLWELNPNLIRGVVPPGDEPYRLRIPPGLHRELPARLAGAKLSLEDWLLHRVNDSDTLEQLASRFRATSTRIREVNRLAGDEELGQREFVIIPL